MDLSITHIPEEINKDNPLLKEILVRLPVKSLARFKCVSKTWLFLISSYKFAKEQLKISSTKNNNVHQDRLLFGSGKLPTELYTCSIQSLVLHEDSNSQIYPTTEHDKNSLFDRARVENKNNNKNNPLAEQQQQQHGVIRIVGSCNGLICLISHPTDTFYLWNPTTGKLKRLPDSGTDTSFDPQGNRGFALVYAFGYDELHDDYKVVESCHTMENGWFVKGGLALKVYSLRNNSWKPLSNWPAGDGHTYGGMGKFHDGSIHWIVREFRDDVLWAMVSHDLATDAFTVSQVPETGGSRVSLGVSEGQLALFAECSFHMDVWVMMKEHRSWTKSISIPYLLEESKCFEDTDFISPVPLFCWVEKGKVLIDYQTSLGVFDLNNPRAHRFGKEFSVECTTYLESLVSPNLDDELVLGREMPTEIITEILSRLPVKSLLRFRTVSKEWRSLISSSRFVKAHLNKASIAGALIFDPTKTNNNNQKLYTCSIDSIFADPARAYSVADENPHFEYSFRLESSVVDAPEAEAEIRFVGSCNGLVCLSLSRKNIILINPATGEEKMLPNSGTNDDDYFECSYSFGYDEVHDDYKVVEVVDHVESTTLVQVYSMRTNTWEALLNWPGGDACSDVGKFLNGSIHWLVRDLVDGFFVVRWFLVSLDLATLTFSQSPLPPNILVDINDADDDSVKEVIILGGCLALCCTRRGDMDVWVMKEYGVSESWTLEVWMELGDDDAPSYFARPRPLFFSGDGKILMNYGLSLKICDDSANPQHHDFDTDSRIDAIAYVETLVPVTLEEEEGEDELYN